MNQVVKLLGADIELGNALQGQAPGYGLPQTGDRASRLILQQVPGISPCGYAYRKAPPEDNPQDIGRKWLGNGSCVYIDLGHIELALPETTSAFAFVAAFHAQLRIVEAARQRATSLLPEGERLLAFAGNSDGHGNSWGAHLNVLVTRSCWEDIFHRRLHYLLWLASYQACSVLLGQGKVGSENGAPPVDFQLSQRADFFETLVGTQTTHNRPLINSRDEALCGTSTELARFHHIGCDVTLCHRATLLKVGILQLLLAMVESRAPQIGPELILEDAVSAIVTYSHDPTLEASAPRLSGEPLTALELFAGFYRAAESFVREGGAEGYVPHAEELLRLWKETLELLQARDWQRLSGQLDWVLKRELLAGVLADNPDLTWQSPELKNLDLLYGSLDHDEGLYGAAEQAGLTESLVTEEQIAHFMSHPPAETRAYTRAQLLRLFGGRVLEVNWDVVRVSHPRNGLFLSTHTVSLDNPLEKNQQETGHLFSSEDPASPDHVLAALAQPLTTYAYSHRLPRYERNT